MHTCVDLSLEGAIASHVMDDARATLLDASPLHAGLLFPARFLATKAATRKQSKPILIQSDVQVKEALSDAAVQRLSPDHAKLSVENQLWSLSNALQSLPSPFHTRSPSSCSYTSASFGSAAYDPICVTGISLGLPNALYPDRSVFSADNFAAIFRGDNFISALSTADKQRILNQNVCQVYKKNGQRIKYRLQHDAEVIQVAAMLQPFDLQKEYPYIPSHVVEVLDSTYALAIAAGLEALKDAGIDVVSQRTVNGEVVSVVSGLPEHMQDDTGVIFASSFPALDSLTSEVTKSAAAKARKALKESEAERGVEVSGVAEDEYEYDRKLLFKLLVMANSQLAGAHQGSRPQHSPQQRVQRHHAGHRRGRGLDQSRPLQARHRHRSRPRHLRPTLPLPRHRLPRTRRRHHTTHRARGGRTLRRAPQGHDTGGGRDWYGGGAGERVWWEGGAEG